MTIALLIRTRRKQTDNLLEVSMNSKEFYFVFIFLPLLSNDMTLLNYCRENCTHASSTEIKMKPQLKFERGFSSSLR